jgi:hypothetical protein
MLWISTRCAIDAGSLVATKLKKLRIAASRQLRVPIVPPRSCSACLRNPATSLAARSASVIIATFFPARCATNRRNSRQVSR